MPPPASELPPLRSPHTAQTSAGRPNELPPILNSDFSIGSSYRPSSDDSPAHRRLITLPPFAELDLYPRNGVFSTYFLRRDSFGNLRTDLNAQSTQFTQSAFMPYTTTFDMPSTTRKRTAAAAALASAAVTDAVPSADAMPSAKRRKAVKGKSATVVAATAAAAAASSSRQASNGMLSGDPEVQDGDIVDLVDKMDYTDDAPPPIDKSNWVKIGTFQCVICLDYATALTGTHCGR